MIAGLKPYAEYKDSGLPWFGHVPANWEVAPLARLARQKMVVGQADRQLLSVYLNRGVVRFTDVDAKRTNATSEDLSQYQVVDPGDFVLNNQQAWRGSVGVSSHSGIVSPAYFVLTLSNQYSPKYADLLFRERSMVAQYLVCSKGVGTIQRNLYWPHLKRIGVIVPPPAEQAAIVRFLDWANGRLERAIRAKRKVIALLNEQKQAIIHRAVTRGLPAEASAQAGRDPSVPLSASTAQAGLKPSGIPWLGDIPQHWEVRRLGHAIRLQTGFPFASSGFVQGESGTRLLRGINVTPTGLRWDTVVRWQRTPSDGLDEFALQIGDVTLGMDRPIISSGVRAATVQEKDTPSLLLQRVARLRPTDRLDARFLLLLLRGRLFADYIAPIFTGISVPHLSPEQIKGFNVPLPSLMEQRTIVSYLEAETSGLDTAISRLEREIELLREYRTRLVADVVTGKLDVREAAARLPDEAAPDTVEDDAELSDEAEPADEDAVA